MEGLPFPLKPVRCVRDPSCNNEELQKGKRYPTQQLKFSDELGGAGGYLGKGCKDGEDFCL